LYRLEARGWNPRAHGWNGPTNAAAVFYRITPQGRTVLAEQRKGWQQFAEAHPGITGIEYA